LGAETEALLQRTSGRTAQATPQCISERQGLLSTWIRVRSLTCVTLNFTW
jgi:hypothetical protein